MILKLCQLIEYYIIGTFAWKNRAEIMHRKPVQVPFLILINNPKQPLHTRNCFKIRYFERVLSESLQKVNFIFLSNQIFFNEQGYEKQKEPETSDQSLIRL